MDVAAAWRETRDEMRRDATRRDETRRELMPKSAHSGFVSTAVLRNSAHEAALLRNQAQHDLDAARDMAAFSRGFLSRDGGGDGARRGVGPLVNPPWGRGGARLR